MFYSLFLISAIVLDCRVGPRLVGISRRRGFLHILLVVAVISLDRPLRPGTTVVPLPDLVHSAASLRATSGPC